MLKQVSFCRETGNEPVSPQVLFDALLPFCPITDCVWQEHRYVQGLMNQDELNLT